MDPRAIFHSRLHELLGAFGADTLVAWPGSRLVRASGLPTSGGLAGVASSPRGLIVDEIASALLLPWRTRGVRVSLVFNYNSFAMGLCAALLGRLRRVPVVYDLADDLAETAAHFVPRAFRKLAVSFVRLTVALNLRLADSVSVTTATLARRYGLRPGGFALVPNGVDPGRFKNVPAERTSASAPTRLVYVGTLREWLDFSPLLEAIGSLRASGLPFELRIVGEGAAEVTIRRLAEERGVAECVRFLGPVDYAQVPSILAEADVCLLPFDTGAISENAFPLKLLEYMAARRPVIASPLPAVREVAGDVVWYARTHREYAEALRDIREHGVSPGRLDRGAQIVEEKYSWDIARHSLQHLVAGVGAR